MAIIFHIASAGDWTRAHDSRRYEADSLVPEGFIHCSTRAQVIRVANQRFRGRTDLVLLHIDQDRLAGDVRYEDTEGGGELFPHVYGSLNVDAVSQVSALEPKDDGTFALPEGV